MLSPTEQHKQGILYFNIQIQMRMSSFCCSVACNGSDAWSLVSHNYIVAPQSRNNMEFVVLQKLIFLLVVQQRKILIYSVQQKERVFFKGKYVNQIKQITIFTMFLANKERVETYFEIIGYQERIQGYVCTCVCDIFDLFPFC